MIVRLPSGLIVMPSDKVQKETDGNSGDGGFLVSIDQANGNMFHRHGCIHTKAAYESPKATKGMWYYCPTKAVRTRLEEIAGIVTTSCKICNP